MHDCDTARHQMDHLTGLGADLARRRRVGHAAPGRPARSTSPPSRRPAKPSTPARRAAGRAARSRAGPRAALRGGRRHRGGRPRARRAGRHGDGRERPAPRARGGRAGRARPPRRSTPPRWPTSRGSRSRPPGSQVRREAPSPCTPRRRRGGQRESTAIADVRDALAAIQSVMIDGEVDRNAEALAAAWTDLNADMDQLGGPRATVRPTSELDARPGPVRGRRRRPRRPRCRGLRQRRSRRAAGRARRCPRRGPRGRGAETGGRSGGGAARRRLEEAQAAERALLDQYGFGGYLDVMLTGGRAGAANPARAAAEQRALPGQDRPRGPRRAAAHDRGRRASRRRARRLLEQITDLLGVDPGR